jgi:DNA-binding transcriptional ArsR family regulator
VRKKTEIEQMHEAADRASSLMKVLSHSDRLLILCHLAEGEQSVGELVDTLQISQSALSQHLARMRSERLVETRRESQSVYYSLKEGEVSRVIESLYRIYCN